MAEQDAVASLGWDAVLGWRLRRQGLVEPFPDLPSAVAALAGVQAQVPSAAAHALHLRCPEVAADSIERALVHDRTLVRTWAQRGTLHLLPAAEWRTWIAGLSARVRRVDRAWERYHGITADELETITEAIPEVLAGRRMSREELTAALVERLGAPHLTEPLRSGWGAALKPAANLGRLCHGPVRPDGGVTFVRPVDWLGAEVTEPPVAQAEGVRALIAAFLDACGPATPEDFARWFGVQPARGKRLWRDHAPPLAAVDVDGARAWVTAASADSLLAAEPVEGVWALPAFDPWVLHPRSHRDVTVPTEHAAAVSRAGGWISPVVVVDGWVAATWKAEAAGGVTTVTVTVLRDDLAGRVDAAWPALSDALAGWLGSDVRRA